MSLLYANHRIKQKHADQNHSVHRTNIINAKASPAAVYMCVSITS